MNQKWTRAICTVLTSALVFTGPAVEGTTFSGYINSGLEKVYAKTQKQKDAEKKKSQAEQDLKDKKNEINGLKDQQQTTADDIKNKSAKLDEILAAQKKLQTDITSKQAEIEQNQKDLAAAQEKQQEQYDAMKKRIQFMYENSAEDNIWTAIIESNGITDMLNRIEYVSDVYDSDRALMDSYQAAVEQVKEIGTKLDNDMNELTAMQDDYEKQQADVEAAIVALENQKEQYASQIAQAQQQADNYQNIITAQGKSFRSRKQRPQLQPLPLPERTARQAIQAMMVVEPARAEVLPVTMHQAVERTRVLQQEFQEALWYHTLCSLWAIHMYGVETVLQTV